MDVFISYSHKDREWKDRVAAFMHCMKVNGQFDYETWDDQEIRPGDEWRENIKQAIEGCTLAVLLISADFLSSKFIVEEEVPRLRELREEGRVVIVPVIVRPSPWEVVKWLEPIQHHPADGTALSAGSDHQIEENLKHLVLEMNRLISEAAADAKSSEDETTEDPDGRGPARGVRDFMEQSDVENFVEGLRKSPVVGSLQLFGTKRQATWLVMTISGHLHCILDSQKTKAAGSFDQWSMGRERATPVVVRAKSRYGHLGLVDIGKRQNWLYSHQLFPDPAELKAELEELIQRK